MTPERPTWRAWWADHSVLRREQECPDDQQG
jgi:hypothetical protein